MVIDHTNLTPISGRNINMQIEIASLTKIMTCYLCLVVCNKYKVDIFSYTTRVGDRAVETPGTTAELQNGDILTIY
jgi:D-alanyl-D-alanine carboxypeptidase